MSVLLAGCSYVYYVFNAQRIPSLSENGFVIVLWIGQNISSDFATNLFGVPSSVQIPTEVGVCSVCFVCVCIRVHTCANFYTSKLFMHTTLKTLPALDNPLSFRVRGIIKQLQTQKQHCMKVGGEAVHCHNDVMVISPLVVHHKAAG